MFRGDPIARAREYSSLMVTTGYTLHYIQYAGSRLGFCVRNGDTTRLPRDEAATFECEKEDRSNLR